MIFSRLTLLFVAATAIAVPAFADEPYLQQGIDDFKSQQYEAAADEFRRLQPDYPDSALLHYYLASSFAKLNKMPQAAAQFKKAYRLSADNSSVHQMSAAALKALGQDPAQVISHSLKIPLTWGTPQSPSGHPQLSKSATNGMAQLPMAPGQDSRSSASTPGSNGLSSSFQPYNGGAGSGTGTGNGSGTGAGYGPNFSLPGQSPANVHRSAAIWNASGAQKTTVIHPAPSLTVGGNSGGNPFDSPAAAQRALDQIEQQTASQKSLLPRDAEGLAERTDRQIDNIRKNTDARIQQMETPQGHGRRGSYSNYSQDDIARVQAEADARIAQLRSQKDQSLAAQERARLIQESANNLEQQVVQQHLTGSGIRLMPLGTNLNVRNYETYHSDDDDRAAIPALEAKPLKLSDVNKPAAKPAAAAAPQH